MASTSKADLWRKFVGKTLHDVSTPSIVLDVAKLELNCKRMVDSAARLDIKWRAHIKTHKTVELTRLQVGHDPSTPANIIVSTLLEAENITPLLQEYLNSGRKANVLYAFPLYPSCIDRLAKVSSDLGAGGVSVIVDHPQQVPLLSELNNKSGGNKPLVFIKIDMGYGRAGVLPDSPTANELITAVLGAETSGICTLQGLYAHAGHSYATSKDWEAMSYLTTEYLCLQGVARTIGRISPGHKLVLSVGATPTASALQHPDFSAAGQQQADVSWAITAPAAQQLTSIFQSLRREGFEIEVHAGVYGTLDLQQLATHARDGSLLSSSEIAISLVAEIASLYDSRGVNGTTEALFNAGTLALGREPCTYGGWGIVMPWGGLDNVVPGPEFPKKYEGWQVGKISQEHGILAWKGKKEDEIPLKFGQRVRIWPNHACVAGAGFGHYLIVDSRREGKEDEVIDVWTRWNGW